MIQASCHCGAVKLDIAKAPETVTDCNCSICHRYGVLWAYYPLSDVHVVPKTGVTDIYMWDDCTIQFHRCKTCGCVAYWYPVDESRNRLGVNANLLPRDVLEKARIRHLDGAVTEKYLDE